MAQGAALGLASAVAAESTAVSTTSAVLNAASAAPSALAPGTATVKAGHRGLDRLPGIVCARKRFVRRGDRLGCGFACLHCHKEGDRAGDLVLDSGFQT